MSESPTSSSAVGASGLLSVFIHVLYRDSLEFYKPASLYGVEVGSARVY